MNSTLPYVALAGMLSSLYLHIYSIRGDVALTLAFSGFFGHWLLTALDKDINGWSSFISSFQILFTYLATIVLATITFRLSPLHPLSRFPGPLTNKATSLRSAYMVHKGHRHLDISDLHKKYGKIVRTGPNTLSINSHTAVSPIYMNAAAMKKSSAYEFGGVNGKGLFFMQDKEEHNNLRRIWAPGFSLQSLQCYKEVLNRRTFELMECISARRNEDSVVNLSSCVEHWAHDVSCDVVFRDSNAPDLMKSGDPHGLIESGHSATMVFEILGEVPSLFHILWHLPVTERMRRLETYAGDLISARQKAGVHDAGGDLASHLLQDDSSVPRSPADLRVDILFALQAGSETPSGVVILLVYFLLTNSSVYETLRNELDKSLADPSEYFSSGTLDSLPYLNAVVYEALRLGTPFGGFPRVVPNEGAVIDGEFIPGGTIVSVPTYAQHVSEENFWPEPLFFRPERWLPGGLGPESRTNKAALMAFSYGPYGCLGRALAIQELLIFTARLLLTYDLALAPGFDPAKFMSGVSNLRVTRFAFPLDVVATER